MSVGQALSGGALLLNSLFSSIWVDGGHDDNPGLIDQLGEGNGEGTITVMLLYLLTPVLSSRNKIMVQREPNPTSLKEFSVFLREKCRSITLIFLLNQVNPVEINHLFFKQNLAKMAAQEQQ